MKWSVSARLGAAGLAVGLGVAAVALPAEAGPKPAGPTLLAPVGAGFTLTVADLQFILKNIKISEAHAAREGAGLGAVIAPTSPIGPGVNDIPDPLLPWGLRQVDGRNNNLTTGWSRWTGKDYATSPGKSAWGSADQPFLRETTPLWRSTETPTPPTTQIGPVATTYNPAYRASSVQDSQPRVISNLIVDQSPNNPAAVAAAGPSPVTDGDGSLMIPNVAPNAGVAAPYNGMFAFFGQFYDHGLDLVGKTAAENVVIPLKPDDPLYQVGSPTNFMIANRTVLNQNTDGVNTTTPWVDQNQTFTSHPSHQVFLREYTMAAGRPVATGKLLDGAIAGNIANWAEVKAQAATKLGIQLVDTDVFNVPLLLTDEFGRFLRGPNGLPQLVQADGTVVEGSIATPISTANAARTGHAFLDDIAHTAVPSGSKLPDTDSTLGNQPPPGYYDNELLDRHFITGDGRGNENIGLTAVHTVFHSEHNRLVADIQAIITANAASFAALDWKLANGSWNGERLFQAGRFVTEMEYQHLVFGEFVRKIQPGIRGFVAYDPNLRPDVTAEYAHSVYRFGHSQLDAWIERTNADGSNNDILLLDGFLKPQEFNNGGSAGQLTGAQAAGSIARGMVNQVGNEIDEFTTDTLRNSLLGLPLDLPALNMTRGRDTGMASLNGTRRSFFAQTGNAGLAPYRSWNDFSLALRHQASAVNFVAAYGTHPSILAATTVADKRAAADKLVNDRVDSPVDRVDFMLARNAWANVNGLSVTGLEDIDLWVGGLAEAPGVFGGMLGGTFDYVFKKQQENLQEGDRLYYLSRTAGTNLGVQLESNFFAEIIMRNTDAEGLPGDVFAFPSYTFDMSKPVPTPPITVQPDGAWRYGGNQHVVFNGSAGADRVIAGGGDDTVRGNDGNDWMQGGLGNDNLVGGLGRDWILDSSGVDILNGGPGNDYMASGGPGADSFNGGEGSDFLVGGVDATAMLAGPGNDFAYGGQAADLVSGDDGSDWLEGGTGADTLTGDTVAPFSVDLATPGDDVLDGGSGDDLSDGGGGVDIALGGPGVDTFVGGFGFDWQTYYDPNPATATAAKADLNLFVPLPADILAGLSDGFDGVEALSGGDLDDNLKGDIRTTLTVPLTTLTDFLNLADLAKIPGLRLLLPPGVTSWTAGNILIGGRGSDTLEGRAGNDFLDGDAYLNVMLSVPAASGVTGTVDPATGRILVRSMTVLNQAVLDGTLDPGDITIVRSIESGGYAGETDTAVFTGNRADYTIAYVAGGLVRVTDNVANRDGVDLLRNIERLQFLDVAVVVPLASSPTNVTVTSPTSTSLTVSWTAPTRTGASAVTGYTARAYTTTEANNFNGSCTATGAATTCTITGLTTWTPYYIEVFATNGSGAGAPGPRGRVKMAPGTPPGAPTAVAATPQADGSADVSWAAPASTGGRPITGYTVTAYSAATGGTAMGSCTTTGALTCKLPAAAGGTSRYVEVRASNLAGPGAGNSPRATVVAVAKPGAPTSATAVPADGQAVVNWAAPSSDGGSSVTSYTAKAFATVNGTVPVSTCSVTITGPSTPLTCAIGSLTNGTWYSVEVTATNSVGEGPGSLPRISVKPAVVTAPSAPGTPTVTPASTSALVQWTAPASNGGSPITAYVATAYDASSGGNVMGSCPTSGALSCTITGLTPSTTYWVEVTATNVVGSTASSRTQTTTPALSILNVDNVIVGKYWLKPSWTIAPGTVTGYTAQAFTVASGGTAVASCTTTTALNCQIGGLGAATNYWVEVTAATSGGNVVSPRVQKLTLATNVPGQPTISTLTPGPSQMALTWTAPTATGGSAITGYVVTAYTTFGGATVAGTCTTAGTLGCTINSGLSPATAYWFEVVPVNANGAGVPSARRMATTG